MATTGSVLYVHEHEVPPQSAFSMTTASVYSEKTVADKSFLKRLFRRKRSLTPNNHNHNSSNNNTLRKSNSVRQRSRVVVVEEKKLDATVFVMMPSPHTHPLLSKPCARDELMQRPPTFTFTSHTGSISPSMEGFAHARKMAAIGVERKMSVPSRLESPLGSPSLVPPDVYTKQRREEERAARKESTTTVDGKYVLEWGFFIKCYAEGRFNISNPPDPPPKRPSFDCLAAPAPPNEKQRLKAVKQCSISLTTAVSDKCQRLALLAKMVFQTRMAAVSLVHEQAEVFKAGHSFDCGYVDRSTSIGAHVVLANEPMIILDTARDWRLQGNPLVQGNPHMRFYAGAPIVNTDGHAVGVFAVFDTQPRADFPAASKRKLMDFARLVMTEIELVMEEQDLLRSSKYMPTRVIGQRKVDHTDGNSVIARRGKLEARLLKGIDQEDMDKISEKPPIPAGDITVPAALHIPNPAVTINMWPNDVPGLSKSLTSRKSPPAQFNLLLPPKTRKQLPKRDPFLFDDLLVPQSPKTLAMQKKSLLPSKTMHKPTLAPTPASPTSTVTESISSPIMPTPPQTPSRPFSLALATALATASSSPESTSSLASSNISPTATPCARRRRRRRPTPLLPLPHSITSTAEAAFATSLIARSLNYDLVYLLRVTVSAAPPSPLLPSPGPYSSQQSVGTRVLVAHGLPNPPPVFDANLHLRALRSIGGLIYQNPVESGGLEDDVGYQVGILLPLVKDEDGPGGIVLAAFARKDNNNGKDGVLRGKEGGAKVKTFTIDEVQFLREFGEAMKDILIKADQSRPSTAIALTPASQPAPATTAELIERLPLPGTMESFRRTP